MATTTQTAPRLIYTAEYDWLKIAERQGLEIDYDAEPISDYRSDEYRAMCAAAEIDPDDDEAGVSVLVCGRDCDTIFKPGDLVLTTGPGGDVLFFRRD